MTKNEIVRRLGYIKQLYRQGEQQSKLPESINYMCILTFHDAIDWFMTLACNVKGINDSKKIDLINQNRQGKKKTNSSVALMEYFYVLPELELSSEVEKINKQRNNLKHDFSLPSRIGIAESISTSRVFFETNTKIIFNLNFSEISLTDLISNKIIKKFLKNAELLVQDSHYEKALEEIAKAYDSLYQTDDDLLQGKWSFWSSNYKKIRTQTIPNISRHPDPVVLRITDSLKDVSQTFNINLGRIDEAIKVLSLGIDYRKYRKLMTLIPSVYRDTKGDPRIVSRPVYNKNELPDDTQFCFDLLLDCVLKIQDGSIF